MPTAARSSADRSGAQPQAAASRPEPGSERDDVAEPGSGATFDEELARSRLRRTEARAIVVLATLAVIAAVYFLRPVLMPLAVAWLGKLTLTPLHRRLVARRIPAPVSAGFLVGALLTSVVGITLLLLPAAQGWIERGPSLVATMQERMADFEAPLARARELAAAVENMEGGDESKEAIQVELASRGQLVGQLITGARLAFAQSVVIVIMLFFMLATDHAFLARLVEMSSQLSERKRWVKLVRDVENQFGAYLAMVTMINAMLGVAVGAACYALELPNPILWGTAAAVLNYVPILGALVGVGIVACVGLVTFESALQGILPALAYLALTTIEGWLVTPAILGSRMSLNPIVLIVWLLFWTWAWGIPGALLAVPLLVAFKISLGHGRTTKPMAALVGA